MTVTTFHSVANWCGITWYAATWYDLVPYQLVRFMKYGLTHSRCRFPLFYISYFYFRWKYLFDINRLHIKKEGIAGLREGIAGLREGIAGLKEGIAGIGELIGGGLPYTPSPCLNIVPRLLMPLGHSVTTLMR